jgi:hypothetical protein
MQTVAAKAFPGAQLLHLYGTTEAQTSSCRDPLTVEIYASASW